MSRRLIRHDPLDRALADLFAEPAEPGGAHPSVEELIAYGAGELDAAAAERLLGHLEVCRECSARLVELEPLALPDPPAPAGVVDLERAAAWRVLTSRRRDPAPALPRWLPAVAAALLMATVGLGAWVLTLERSNAVLQGALETVQVDVPVVYLDAVRAGEEESTLLPSDEGLLLLILTPEEPEPFPSYRVEIQDPAGREVWSGGLALNDHGSLRLGVPRRRLESGEHRVLLYGVGAAGEELLAEHRLRLTEHRSE